MLLAGQKSYFAKRSHFGCQKLIPADENAVCQAKGNIKVILPNKTGMSARSSSPKMKIEEEQENTAELGNDAQLDSRTKLDERT